MRIRRFSVDRHLFEIHREGPVRNGHFLQIDRNHALHRREPESSVSALPGSRLEAPIRLLAFHSIHAAVCDRLNHACFAFGEAIELGQGDAKDPFVAAHPQVPETVVQDGEDGIVRKALRARIYGEFAVFQPVQSAAVGSDP